MKDWSKEEESLSQQVDPQEVEKFEALAEKWHDPQGPMKVLHDINPLRIEFVVSVMRQHFARTDRAASLSDLSVLDLGCGAGLLSEPLARLGARVTGLDPSEGNIRAAQAHAHANGLEIDYVAGILSDLPPESRFSCVAALEVVEHVPDAAVFIKDAVAYLKPGGLFIGSTINKTVKAFFLAILGAENILRWLPAGTHQFERFLSPEDFEDALGRAGVMILEKRGLKFNLFRKRWSFSTDLSVNYFIAGQRQESIEEA